MSKQKATCCIYSCSDLERWTKSVSVFGKPQSHNLAFLGWILWYTSSDISLHAFTLCNCYCNYWSCKYWVIFNCLESGFIRKQVFYQSSRIVNRLFHSCEKVRHTLKIFFKVCLTILGHCKVKGLISKSTSSFPLSGLIMTTSLRRLFIVLIFLLSLVISSVSKSSKLKPRARIAYFVLWAELKFAFQNIFRF